MCDQTEVSYLPGNIVWVKIGPVWWPGKVVANDAIEHITKKLKTLIAVVTFFQEDKYEFVKKLSNIYHYNCLRKIEFIKKGLSMLRSNSKNSSLNMHQFPEDIATAEALTNGNPEILNDDIFRPEDKIDYTNIFPSNKKTSKTPKTPEIIKKKDSPAVFVNTITDTAVARPITHPRFIRLSQGLSVDYEARYLIQPAASAQTKLKTYTCCLCNFTAHFMEILTYHYEDHFNPKNPLNTKKFKNKFPVGEHKSVHSNNKVSNERTIRSTPEMSTSPKKIRYTGSATKKNNMKKVSVCQKTLIDEDLHKSLLQDWLEDEEFVEEQPLEFADNDVDQVQTKLSEEKLSRLQNNISCFDFDDAEDSVMVHRSNTYRSMMPRLSEKRTISEDKISGENENCIDMEEKNTCMDKNLNDPILENSKNNVLMGKRRFSVENISKRIKRCHDSSNAEDVVEKTSVDVDSDTTTITTAINIPDCIEEKNTELIMEEIIKNTQQLTDGTSIERINKFIHEIDVSPIIQKNIYELQKISDKTANSESVLGTEFNPCQNDSLVSIHNQKIVDGSFKRNCDIKNMQNHEILPDILSNKITICDTESELKTNLCDSSVNDEMKTEISNNIISKVESDSGSLYLKNCNEIKKDDCTKLENDVLNQLKEENLDNGIESNTYQDFSSIHCINSGTMENKIFDTNDQNLVINKQIPENECIIGYRHQGDSDVNEEIITIGTSEYENENNKMVMDISNDHMHGEDFIIMKSDLVSDDISKSKENISDKYNTDSSVYKYNANEKCDKMFKKDTLQTNLVFDSTNEMKKMNNSGKIDAVSYSSLSCTNYNHSNVIKHVPHFLNVSNSSSVETIIKYNTNDNSDQEIMECKLVSELETPKSNEDAYNQDETDIYKVNIHSENDKITNSREHTVNFVDPDNYVLNQKEEIKNKSNVSYSKNDVQKTVEKVHIQKIKWTKSSEEYIENTLEHENDASNELKHTMEMIKLDTDAFNDHNKSINTLQEDIIDELPNTAENFSNTNPDSVNITSSKNLDLHTTVNKDEIPVMSSSISGSDDTNETDNNISKKLYPSYKLEEHNDVNISSKHSIKNIQIITEDTCSLLNISNSMDGMIENKLCKQNISEDKSLTCNKNNDNNDLCVKEKLLEKVDIKKADFKRTPSLRNNLVIQSICQLKVNDNEIIAVEDDTWFMNEETSSEHGNTNNSTLENEMMKKPDNFDTVVINENVRSEPVKTITSVQDMMECKYLEQVTVEDNSEPCLNDNMRIMVSNDETEIPKNSVVTTMFDGDIFSNSYNISNHNNICVPTTIEGPKSEVKLEASIYDFDDDDDDDLQEHTNMLKKEIDELISNPETASEDDDTEFNQFLKFGSSHNNNCYNSEENCATSTNNITSIKTELTNESSFISNKTVACNSISGISLYSNYSLASGTSINALLPGTAIKTIPISLAKKKQISQTVDVLSEPKCSILMSSETSDNESTASSSTIMPPPPPPPPLNKKIQLKNVTNQEFKQPLLPSGNHSVNIPGNNSSTKLGPSCVIAAPDPETGVQKYYRITLDQQKILASGEKSTISHDKLLQFTTSMSVSDRHANVTLAIAGQNSHVLKRLLSIKQSASDTVNSSISLSSSAGITTPYISKPVVSAKVVPQVQGYHFIQSALPNTSAQPPTASSDNTQHVKLSTKSVILQAPLVSSLSSTETTATGIVRNISHHNLPKMVSGMQKQLISTTTSDGNINMLQTGDCIRQESLDQSVAISSTLVGQLEQQSKALLNDETEALPPAVTTAYHIGKQSPSISGTTQVTLLKQDDSSSLANYSATTNNSCKISKQDILAKALEDTVLQSDVTYFNESEGNTELFFDDL